MSKQIGRNVYNKATKSKYDIKLSITRRYKHVYYEIRIKLLERRMKKYGTYSDYRMELCNAAIYHKQSYMYKVEALYSLQELKDYEKRRRRRKSGD